jgi:hypothetical protein
MHYTPPLAFLNCTHALSPVVIYDPGLHFCMVNAVELAHECGTYCFCARRFSASAHLVAFCPESLVLLIRLSNALVFAPPSRVSTVSAFCCVNSPGRLSGRPTASFTSPGQTMYHPDTRVSLSHTRILSVNEPVLEANVCQLLRKVCLQILFLSLQQLIVVLLTPPTSPEIVQYTYVCWVEYVPRF